VKRILPLSPDVRRGSGVGVSSAATDVGVAGSGVGVATMITGVGVSVGISVGRGV
jgi:hypothetical protein